MLTALIIETENTYMSKIHFFIKGDTIIITFTKGDINCQHNVYRLIQYDGGKIMNEVNLIMETINGNLQCVNLEVFSRQLIEIVPVNYFTIWLKQSTDPTVQKSAAV